MTISMAWIRERGRYEELLFCSDSRLRFGCAWDSCQKIFPLPRGDCAISFAGDTHFAFPFIHTAINAVSLHRGSRNRLIDITVAKGYLLNAINSMLTEIGDLRSNQEHHDEPVLRLIFGGYSWIEKKFVSWLFYYNPGERKFIEGPMGQWRGLGENRNLIIIGDPEASVSAVKRANRTGATVPDNENDVQQMAKDRFVELLRERGIADGAGLDMEPFEVLCEMLREQTSPHIGGSPQLVKIYQHMNSQPIGIRWEQNDNKVLSVLGRTITYPEKMHVPVLDPHSLKFERESESRALDFNESEAESNSS